MPETLADDCVRDFLADLDESVWLLTHAQRSPTHAFSQATRKPTHITDLRRVLHRLHQLLLDWEQAA